MCFFFSFSLQYFLAVSLISFSAFTFITVSLQSAHSARLHLPLHSAIFFSTPPPLFSITPLFFLSLNEWAWHGLSSCSWVRVCTHAVCCALAGASQISCMCVFSLPFEPECSSGVSHWSSSELTAVLLLFGSFSCFRSSASRLHAAKSRANILDTFCVSCSSANL